MKKNLIEEKTFDFSIDIIRLCKLLNASDNSIIGRQLLRCGTSIGANVHEASAGSSKRDFINKMTISKKEARECEYWLRLLHATEPGLSLQQEMAKIDEINRILTSILRTAKSNTITQ